MHLDTFRSTAGWFAVFIVLVGSGGGSSGIGRGSNQTGTISGSSIFQRLPTAGADVEIRRTDEGPVLATTVADATGTFRLAQVETGTYLLRVTWAGMSLFQRVVTVPAFGSITVDISTRQECQKAADDQQRLPDADMAELIRSVLRLHLLPDARTPLVIDGVPQEWLERLGALPATPMTRRALQELANRQGQVSYLYVSDIRARSDCPAMTVGNTIEVDARKKDSLVLIGGSSLRYQFTRRGEHWEFDLIGITEV
jgi:hypothetical protein